MEVRGSGLGQAVLQSNLSLGLRHWSVEHRYTIAIWLMAMPYRHCTCPCAVLSCHQAAPVIAFCADHLTTESVFHNCRARAMDYCKLTHHLSGQLYNLRDCDLRHYPSCFCRLVLSLWNRARRKRSFTPHMISYNCAMLLDVGRMATCRPSAAQQHHLDPLFNQIGLWRARGWGRWTGWELRRPIPIVTP